MDGNWPKNRLDFFPTPEISGTAENSKIPRNFQTHSRKCCEPQKILKKIKKNPEKSRFPNLSPQHKTKNSGNTTIITAFSPNIQKIPTQIQRHLKNIIKKDFTLLWDMNDKAQENEYMNDFL